MTKSKNHWAARFESLIDPAVIKQRAEIKVPPLVDLAEMPVDLACKRLEIALETIFHPTTQCVAILQRLFGIAHAHCVVTYPDSNAFLRGVYADEKPLPSFSPPICLTGLSGVGKSKLLDAFRRLQAPEKEVTVDTSHPPFLLSGAWSATIQARSSPKDVLRTLAGMDDSPAELIKRCRKLGFRDGVPFILADEFQFATGSENANARLSQMLFSLCYIGIPFLFAANYSLLHRLQRRPEEEQQRLLSNPIVLATDAWNSIDWMETIEAQRVVAPNYLRFDHAGDAKELHAYSAGRKRAMAQLILIAFRQQYPNRGVVDIRAIRNAYQSAEYARYKDQAEILAAQAINNNYEPKRKDLRCPIPEGLTKAQQFLEYAINEREEKVAEVELEAVLNRNERKTVHEIRKKKTDKTIKSEKVIQMSKKQTLSAEALKQNASWLRNQI